MNYTYTWQAQPYKSWKGKSTYSVVPTWSRPLPDGQDANNPPSEYSTSDLYTTRLTTVDPAMQPSGPAFKARPIKHWRKQLNPRAGSGRSSAGIGMPMDNPGGAIYLGPDASACLICGPSGLPTDASNILYTSEGTTENFAKSSATELPPPGSEYPWHIQAGDKALSDASGYLITSGDGRAVCLACNPENNVIKRATTLLNKNYYTDSRAYLRSRCKLYDQKLSGLEASGSIYYTENGEMVWPFDGTRNYNGVDQTGPQNRAPIDCPARCQQNAAPLTIYKPNNPQFGMQGATSSSNRILRLKVNTVTKNGAALATAFGAEAASAASYHGRPETPFITKSKFQRCVSKRLPGNHTMCFTTPSGAIGNVASLYQQQEQNPGIVT